MFRNSSATPRVPLHTDKATGKMENVVDVCTPASPFVNASPVSPAGIHSIVGGDDATINGLTPSTPLHDIVVHKNITNTNNHSHEQDCGTRSGSGSSIAGQSLDALSSGKTKESLEGAGESVTIVLGAASVDGFSSVAATPQATPGIARASTSPYPTERTVSSADERKDGSGGNASHNSSAVHHLPMDVPNIGDNSKEGKMQPYPSEITPHLTAAIVSGDLMSTADADTDLKEIDPSVFVASSVAGLGPSTTHIEVYAPETRTMYHSIPLEHVSHKGHSDSPKFYLCQSHSARNQRHNKMCVFSTLANEKANQSVGYTTPRYPTCDVTACAMGNQCRFVHINVPLTQLKGDVIHVHYVYRNEDCCSYESLSHAVGLDEEASTMHLSVLGPRCQEPVEKIQVTRILKTEGSVKAYSQLCQKIKRGRSVPNQKVRSEQLSEVSDKGKPEGGGALTGPTDTLVCHCQHYYFNQICNRGASCAFIHVISVDKSQERDNIRPPSYKKRIQATGDLRRDQQPLESTQMHPRLPSSTNKPSPTDADLGKQDIRQNSNVIPSQDASSLKGTGDLANLRDDRRKSKRQLEMQTSTAAESLTKQRLCATPEIRGASHRGTAAAQKFVALPPTSFVTVRIGSGQQNPAAVGEPSSTRSPATISIGGVTLKTMPISSAYTGSAAFEESREFEDCAEVMSTASTMTARSIVGSSPWNVNFPRVGPDLSPRSSIAMRRMPHEPSPSTSPNQVPGSMRQGEAGGNNTFLLPEMGPKLLGGPRQNSFSMASGGGCDSPLLCEALGDVQMGGAHIDSRKRRRGGAGARRDATQSNDSPDYADQLSIRVGASPRSGPIHACTEGNGIFFMGGGVHSMKGRQHSRAHTCTHERQNTSSLNMGQSAVEMSQIDTAVSSSPCSGVNTPAIARAPPGRYVHNPYGQRSGHCTPVTLTRGNTEILESPLVSQHQLIANETCLPPSDC